MNGVTKLELTDNRMLISFSEAPADALCATLDALAAAGVVVDMISQTPPQGGQLRFCFTADAAKLDVALAAMRMEANGRRPMVSGGYSKLNLYGEEMVHSVGVAARALSALQNAGIDVTMITTSDLDISLLVRQEDADIACDSVRAAFKL